MTLTDSKPLVWRLAPLVADLLCTLAFALGGRNTHEAEDPLGIVLVIAWPFAVSVVLVHALLLWRGRPTYRVWPEGVTVVAVTYVLGMGLRAASGRGLAGGFLVVAAIFLAATMLGWRGVVGLVAQRRT